MRWTFGLPRLRLHRFSVVGLDVGPHTCSLAILAGSVHQPDTLCCVERLDLPDAWVVQGEVVQPVALGRWLKTYLAAGDYQPQAICMGLDNAGVSNHLVSLAAGLSADDVAFQLQAEVQSGLPKNAAEVWVDYGIDTESSPVGQQRYWVQAVARARVEALQRVAREAGLMAMSVEPRAGAVQRAEQMRSVLTALPQASAALALQCDEAFGLALRAWRDEGSNFLPRRPNAQHVLRRAWLLGLAVCAMGGAVLAAGFAMVVASAAARQYPTRDEVEMSARALDEAEKAHAQAKALADHDRDQARWLAERQRMQLQSVQWSRVLSRAAQGLWVASVKQEGARWVVQGEALSAKHAQQLLQHLKALDIWAQTPVMQQLRVQPEPSATGVQVWQFRIEADLKVGA